MVPDALESTIYRPRGIAILTILMRISAKEGSYNRYHSRDRTGAEAGAHTRNGQDYETSNIFYRDHGRDERESLPDPRRTQH